MPESINVSEHPELKEKVRDGSLFIQECPSCGERHLAQYQTLYHDPEASLLIWLLPGGAEPPSGVASIASQLPGYTLRIVRDAGSLIEKVNIHDAGLDDATVELCKYVTRHELAEKQGAKALELNMKFYRLQGADNEIVLSFPMDGAMHAVNIGFNVYEDCSAILLRNPDAMPSEGFARVDSDWVDTIFK